MATNYRQIYAIRRQNEGKILRLCPEAKQASGIYCFYRIDENNFRFCYVGQASKDNLLSRCASHLEGYKQHIDLSIRKYGLYDEEKNPYGYKLMVLCYCPAEECDEKEQLFIRQYADDGWQLKNVEIGGKSGKTDMNERKPSKGYREGVTQGRKQTQKEIAKLFEKNLTYTINGKSTKNKEKAYEKFTAFLNENKVTEEEDEI
jgi:hypothetical protein